MISDMNSKFCKFCNCNHPITVEYWYIYHYGNKQRLACRKRVAQYCKDNADMRAAACLRYENKNKTKRQERKKEYYDADKERILGVHKKYRDNNREKINTYIRDREKRDIEFKISRYMRTRIVSAIIKGTGKSGSAVRDLGCTIPELKQYLASKFQEGMSWDNWGMYGWHIDHIIPLSGFDLTDRVQFLKACHYTNLQPLWAKDNLSKGRGKI